MKLSKAQTLGITKEEIKLIEQLVKLSIQKGEIGNREDLIKALE